MHNITIKYGSTTVTWSKSVQLGRIEAGYVNDLNDVVQLTETVVKPAPRT